MSKSVRSTFVIAGIALSLLTAAYATAEERAPATSGEAGRSPASAVQADPAAETSQAAPAREAGETLEELPRQILPRRWYNY